MLSLLQAAAENAESGSSVNPFVIGGSALVFLLILMLVLLAFGRGREHT